MKKLKIFSAIICFALLITIAVGCTKPSEPEKTPMEGYLKMEILPETTKLVHNPYYKAVVDNVYRYGPSMMLGDDGGIEMWTASPGRFKTQWDWIRYRKTLDNGETWSDETIACKSTPGTEDAWSVCDPGLIKIGEWYYMGYTSCFNLYGRANSVFLARSKNSYGPFDEKWTGSGWGTDARAIVKFDDRTYNDETRASFGAGEPTFTIVDNTLYMYYTWDLAEEDTIEYGETRVATADLSGDPEMWPSKLQERGVAFERQQSEDSGDVAYLEQYKRFVHISIAERFTEGCYLVIRQSEDGINWEHTGTTKKELTQYAHNAGISKRSDGHIKQGDKIYIAYAHSDSQNAKDVFWATRMAKVKFNVATDDYDDGENDFPIWRSRRGGNTGSYTDNPQAVYVADPYVRIRMGDPNRTLRIKMLTNKMDTNVLNNASLDGKLKFEYNNDIIDISSTGVITAKKTGTVHVSMMYDNKAQLSDNFVVYVGEGDFVVGIASGGNVNDLTDSDVDTEFKTQSEKENESPTEKWFGLQTKDNKISTLAGIHLYGQIEANWFPKTYDVQIMNASGQWETVPSTDWTYHSATLPSTSTAIIPVTIVFNKSLSTSAVRIKGKLSADYQAIGVSGMEAFSNAAEELKVIKLELMKTDYTMVLGAVAPIVTMEYKQIKVYIGYNFLYQKELFTNAHGITYNVVNSGIATVNQYGWISPVSKGTTKVDVLYNGKIVGTAVINVI